MKGYQATLFQQLDPDTTLDERVVLLGDPRWDSCVEELRNAVYIGIDTEFYEDGKGPFRTKDEINYWKAAIRLIQVGLPSGRVLIFDLGGLFSDRSRCIAAHWPTMMVLKEAIESRRVKKVGMALLTEYLLFRIHFGWRMRNMRDVMLYSQVIWAGVGATKGRYEPWGFVPQPRLLHKLEAICTRLKIPIDKREQTSDWAGKLAMRQYNYAGVDALVVIDVWRALSRIAVSDGLMKSIEAETGAQPCFCECEFEGLPVNAEMARRDLAVWIRVRDEFWSLFRRTFPGAQPTSPYDVAEVLGEALDIRLCGGCGFEYDPVKDDNLPWQQVDLRCPVCKGPKEGFKRKKLRTFTDAEGATRTADENLVPYEHIPYVKSLLEGRATSACLTWLNAVVENMAQNSAGQWVIRTDFRQIAGGYQEHGTKNGEAGKGMGRSSAGNPVNTQNPSVLQPSHKKAGAPSVRNCVRPADGEAFIVIDLSQAHMRIAAQVSQDPQMLKNFRDGIDAHLALTVSLLNEKGQKLGRPELANLDIDAASKIRKDKKHPLFDEVKTTRDGSKNVGYGSLNMQGGATLKRTAETAHEPIFMTEEEATARRDKWREVYPVLYGFQRTTISRANSYNHNFDAIGVQGRYGEVRALTGRRLFLIKNWQPAKYEWQKKGNYSVKGTDCVSAVWMMTEADIIKYAMGLMLQAFDEHPEWEAKFRNMAHDEVDITCKQEFALPTATAALNAAHTAMRWAGIVDIPVDAADASPEKLIVTCWADK